ncbi:PREDICTED: uncharacterized protein LOC106335987 [Brassica oleracea var. oleracea]|uniref:uncharacterized protein LOC106335987 n=1 Tax=Brassica oleracea var. oleracea TaxID=109376 RepID=UPI0006A6CB2F|nr:PREDICTED: uncharacterized protein LOC106335987 [Brassica oleracea var. oleracea]
MAVEKFGPHLKTILEAKHIEAIYELWGVDYAVKIELPEDGETPATMRPGYCGAYMSHFEDGGLSFPLPRFLLEALAELKMAFTQMAPNFFRYFLATWVRAQEEGLEFGLRELKQLFAIKRNNGFLGTMILAPRSGRVIIEGIPNKDDRWRENLFVFKVNLASVGDFEFERIPREWSDDIEPFGPAPMTPELRGLMATLRRGSPRWLAFTHDRIRTAYALPLGVNRATHVALVAPVRPKKGRGNKRKKEKEVLLDRPDDSSEARSLERAQKVQRGPVLRSRSQAQSPGLLARPVSVAIPAGGTRKASDNSAFSYDNVIPILENPDSLAAIWRKIRTEGCELPSLERMRESDAYVRMAVANAKAMEASNEYAALMEGRLANFPSKEEIAGHFLTIQQLRGELEVAREAERQREAEIEESKRKLAAAEAGKVAIQSDLDSMKEKHRREIEGRDRQARKDRYLARLSLAREYDGETAAEIHFQEVRARIEALTEYNEGGFELKAELERLKDLEISLEVDYGLASVSDPSLSRLDLPDISSKKHIYVFDGLWDNTSLIVWRRRTETDQEFVLWAFIWPDCKSIEQATFRG